LSARQPPSPNGKGALEKKPQRTLLGIGKKKQRQARDHAGPKKKGEGFGDVTKIDSET